MRKLVYTKTFHKHHINILVNTLNLRKLCKRLDRESDILFQCVVSIL
jgi:hypothetical protein